MSHPSDWIDNFVEDGHVIHVTWDRDSLDISYVECPHEGVNAVCNRLRQHCVVKSFFAVYGTALNIGRISVNGPIEIAWLPIPGECDIDREFSGIWIIPVMDAEYLEAKLGTNGGS